LNADLLRSSLIYMGRSPVAKKVVTETPLRGMAQRFVAGETVDEVLEAIEDANTAGLHAIANYLGESVGSELQARRAADVYVELMERVRARGLRSSASLKFTQLGQDIGDAFLRDNLSPVLHAAEQCGVFLRFDMESSEYTQPTLDAFEALWTDGWRDIGVVLQAYLHRSVGDVHRMNRLGAQVRLCKGAYAEPPEVAFQSRDEVSRSFIELMRLLLAEGNYPAIATHDERMIDATVEFAQREGIGPDGFEFQMLYGVRRDLQTRLAKDGWRVSAYIPFGEAWYPYLMRRLAERPANMLFMAGSIVQETPLGFLWPKGR